MNKFITVEGIDGSGKDTQLEKMIDLIKGENNSIFGDKYSNIWITRNPTNITKSGKTISRLIREKDVSLEEASKYYIEDRKEHTKIIKNMLEHSFVLSSRYAMSTLAYQSAQGESIEKLYNMHNFEKGDCITPDLTILFDIDPKISLERAGKRGQTVECFEKLEFLTLARKKYLEVAEFLRKKGRKIEIIDSSVSIEEVTKILKERLKKYN